MEKPEKSKRAYLGGVISGIGIGVILAAAFVQYTRYNLANYTTLTVASGLIAIAAGYGLARSCCRCRNDSEKA